MTDRERSNTGESWAREVGKAAARIEAEEKARERGRETGPAGQAAAADRRERWEKAFAKLRQLIGDGVPELAAPDRIGGHLEALAAAKTQREWDTAVAGLVSRLFRLVGRGGERCVTAQYIWATGRISGFVARGFVAPASPVANSALLKHDAWILEFEKPATIADAIDVLDRWDRASLLPHQTMQDEPSNKRKARLRKRAERAAAHAGIELRKRPKAPPA